MIMIINVNFARKKLKEKIILKNISINHIKNKINN